MKDTCPYKHIIWDWNGTLLNDLDDCLAILNDMMTTRQLGSMTRTRYHAEFSFPVRDFYQRIGFDFTRESYEDIAAEYINGYVARLRACALQPGALDTLAAFRQAGLTQSVLSAYEQTRLEAAVKQFQLEHWFMGLIGLDDYYAHSKSENGRQWIARLPYQPADVLFIGDTHHDHEVASDMGVDCVLLTCGHQPRSRLASCNVPLFDTLLELRSAVLAGQLT